MTIQKKKAVTKILKIFFQYVLLLTLIAGLSRSVIDLYPISHHQETLAQEKIRRQFFAQILPAFDNEPWRETLKNGNHVFYVARNNAAPPRIYQPVPSMLNVPALAMGSRQTKISGFAFVMESKNKNVPLKLLAGMDLEGNLTGVQRLSPASSLSLDFEKKTTEDLIREAKELFSAHRDLLMLQLEPEDVNHA